MYLHMYVYKGGNKMELENGQVAFNGAEFGMLWKNAIDIALVKNISIGSKKFTKLFKQLWDREHEIREAIEIEQQLKMDKKLDMKQAAAEWDADCRRKRERFRRDEEEYYDAEEEYYDANENKKI